ncbi:MAG: helix-turn-helix transcriptional regulator [Sedimentisphaerales bacterium]|nr:helix-turn-helix transcriptional regulator [Sedimentisphaerales bacterium]
MNYLLLDKHQLINTTADIAGLFVSRGIGKHIDRKIDTWELLFVRNGELSMMEDNQVYTIKKYQTLLLEPQRQHVGAKEYAKDLVFYWLHFRLPKSKEKGGNHKFELRLPKLGNPARPEIIMELLHRYLDDQKSGRLKPLQATLLVSLILAEVADYEKLHTHVSQHQVLAEQIENYLVAHAHEPITTHIVAEALGYNPDYLGQVYKQEFGQTITDAIHHKRVAGAQQMLLNTSLNISEIAFECGFMNVGYFRKIFRRFIGITPGQYRRMHTRTFINLLGGSETTY